MVIGKGIKGQWQGDQISRDIVRGSGFKDINERAKCKGVLARKHSAKDIGKGTISAFVKEIIRKTKCRRDQVQTDIDKSVKVQEDYLSVDICKGNQVVNGSSVTAHWQRKKIFRGISTARM
jgi:hypothetical protein